MDSLDYYNAIAGSYEALYLNEQTEKIEKLVDAVKPKPSDMILDVGAGSGLLEEALKGFHITAVEPSDLADRITEKHLENVIVEKKRFADFNTDRRFDIVFSITVLQDMPGEERSAAIDKMLELCKPGGKLAVSVLKKSGLDYSNLNPSIKGEAGNDIFFIFIKQDQKKALN